MSLWFVSATRLAESEFDRESALARSLARVAEFSPFVLAAAYENSRPLPEIFNRAIDAAGPDDTIVFVHDDVWIDDYFIAQRVAEGLDAFDVIGVAGNRRRVDGQPAWLFVDERLNWDDRSNLSGSVAHGVNPLGPVSSFGPAPVECALLGGGFIRARRSTLGPKGGQFGPGTCGVRVLHCR